MGTDIHGPWIEQENRYKPKGGEPYPWECVAVLPGFFNRDYLLFDILNGMRHGNQSYTVQPKTTGIPPDPSHEWRTHFTVKDKETGKRYTPQDLWTDDMSLDVRMRLGSHFGFSTMDLDMVKEVQRVYVEVSAQRKDTPEAKAELAVILERDEARKRGDKVGMLALKGYSMDPIRHPGLDLAIHVMAFAENLRDLPTRMSMCYDN